MAKLRFLVATDFSAVAQNALRYALELAKFLRAELSVLHVWRVPVAALSEGMAFDPMTIDELQETARQKMEQEVKRMCAEYPTVNTSFVVWRGFVVEAVKDFVLEQPHDLLIVGTRSGDALERWLGSVTTALIEEIRDMPVLAVPPDASFHGIFHIAFATDCRPVDINKAGMRLIKYIAERFDASIHIIHVKKAEKALEPEKEEVLLSLDRYFQKYRHDYHLEEAASPEDAIESYVLAHNIDWLVMIPHQQSVFKRLFDKSHTRRMLFKTHVPLLSIHA
jgi:nucleotide-binding universal stress UspA family protein